MAPQARADTKALEVFLNRWEKAKIFTLQVADAMPADGYAYNPKSELREYGKLMQHIGANNAFYISRFKGGLPDSMKPPEQSDKETTMKFLATTFDYCAGVLKGLTEKDLDQILSGPSKSAAAVRLGLGAARIHSYRAPSRVCGSLSEGERDHAAEVCGVIVSRFSLGTLDGS